VHGADDAVHCERRFEPLAQAEDVHVDGTRVAAKIVASRARSSITMRPKCKIEPSRIGGAPLRRRIAFTRATTSRGPKGLQTSPFLRAAGER
jgi:hypothetical protein